MTLSISLSPLTSHNLAVFRSLLGGPDFGGCFCALWTSFDQTWPERCRDEGQPNFKITQDDVIAGRQAGFLVFAGPEGDVIGWTGAGPKTEFPLLADWPGSRLSDFSETIWAIGCIALKADYRGQGLAEKVILAVIEKAKAVGAASLEAYPTRPWDEPRSYRGAYTMYERLGFELMGREWENRSEDRSANGSEILLMQLPLLEKQ